MEKIVPGGDALVRGSDGVVFVPGVLPGERILYDVVHRKKGWAKGCLTDLLEPSASRVDPFCPLFGRCGGCRWQHMEYSAQLEAKVSFAEEALSRQGGFDENGIPSILAVPSRPDSYRSRIRPFVLPEGSAGFRESKSDKIVGIGSCPVAVDGVNRFLGNPLETLISGSEPVVFGDEEEYWVEGLHPEARASVAGKDFRFPPGVFFQSNMGPLPELVEFVLDGKIETPEIRAIGSSSGQAGGKKGAEALDLYGGVGLFGAFLAERFESVHGVDRDSAAGSSWMRHVGPRGEFHALGLEEWIGSRAGKTPDFVVVDPPRTGLSQRVRTALAELRAPRIAYVSCDPVTQARDLGSLVGAGYAVEEYAVFDLYPQTPHAETVARLRYVGKERN